MKNSRLFRFVLKLLPSEFRARYGSDIEQVFRDEREGAGDRVAVAGVWTRTIGDVFKTGLTEHVRQLRQDVKYTLRDMRKRPGFVAAAVLTLAVGIGMNAAMFGVLYAVLLRPLPYSEPDRLVAVWNRWQGQGQGRFSDPEFLDLQEQSRTMKIAAMVQGEIGIAGDRGDAERLPAAYVSTNAFSVLGVAPKLGRGFLPEEEVAGRDAVVIITEGLWERRFHSNPAIVGQTLLVDGRKCEIVGVFPSGVRLPPEFGNDESISLIVPLTLQRSAPRMKRGGHYLRVVGRLNDGETVKSAGAELAKFIAEMKQTYASEYDMPEFGGFLRPLRDDLLGESRQTLMILSIAVGLVLLLACANVANLMLARGEARRSELAIRTALGASRFRIVRQLLTEGLVLSCLGAVAGIGMAALCQKVVLYWAGNGAVALPRLSDVSLNVPVLIFTVALALLTPLLFGLFPAVPISRAANGTVLIDSSRGSSGRLRPHVRRLLVSSQVMIATVLLISSGLLLKSLARVLEQPSGIVSDHVLTFRVSLPEAQYAGVHEISSFYTRLVEKVAALPGVKTVGSSSGLPMSVGSGDWSFDIEGRPSVGRKHAGKADWYVVTPGYFETLGIALVQGRLPQSSDDEQSSPVIFINETTAKTVFPNESPIGYRLRLTNTTGAVQPWRTIAGVVKDVRQRGLESPPSTEMYIPHTQFQHFSAGGQMRDMTIVVSTSVEPMTLMPTIRGELSKLDPLVPAAQVRDMDTVVRQSFADRQMTMTLVSAFGVLAIILAIIGVYGVMDYTVIQRTREIGVRLAIGASRGEVRSLILRDGMRLVAMGVAVGTVLSAIFASVLATLLYDVRPRDGAVYAMAAVIVVCVGMFTIYLPARRGSRMDPMAALRTE
jgi:putative ABC transport system permease protein